MRIHWVNSRGDDRSAESIAVFIFEDVLYHVAICPDYFRQPRVFKEVSVDVTGTEVFRWCEPL